MVAKKVLHDIIKGNDRETEEQMIAILPITAAMAVILWLIVGYIGFCAAIRRGKELDIKNRESLKGTSWDYYYNEIQEGIRWIESRPAEHVYILSGDGLKLHGRLILNPDARGTVLMFHGYRTHPEVDFSASAHVYYECGNHLLLIDQRAAGESEGKFIGFGVLESRDCKCWIDYITERFGEKHPIILAGLSMGASTVLMAAAQPLPENVTGIVADSAFSSPRDIICRRIQQNYHCSGKLITAAVGLYSRLAAGYSLKEKSVLEAMESNCVPVLFVHGKNDSTVPVEMTIKAAERCRAPKQVFLVEGAEHGCGYLVENQTYIQLLRQFCTQENVHG